MSVDAGTIYAQIRIELNKLKSDLSIARGQIKNFGTQNKNTTNNISKNWKAAYATLAVVGAAAFSKMSTVVKNAVTIFANFEQSIANVQSVARATPEEFAKIEEAARSAGERTRFTASQAADALYALASAGLDANQSVAALDGVLQLAGATQSDLASTSASVVSTIAQFNLAASDSTRISNVFAAAIGNSQANMDKLTNAFRAVGPVAGALGISLEETTGAIQALLDAGFQGEQAGTALRNILSGLANEADPTSKKLTALGISFADLNPEVNGLTEVIGTLQGASLDASDILAAFGDRAGPAMLSLLRVGQNGLEDYTDAVTETNAAAEAYAVQNDTLQGSIDQLGSAAESLTISFVKEFAPVIRGLVDLAKNLVNGINSLPGPVKAAIAVIGVGIPTVLGLTSAFIGLQGILAGVGLTIGAIAGPITIAVAGVAAVVAGTIAIANSLDTIANSLDTSAAKTRDMVDALEDQGDRLQELKNRYIQLRTQEKLSTAEKQELKKITEEINSIIPKSAQGFLTEAKSARELSKAINELTIKEKEELRVRLDKAVERAQFKVNDLLSEQQRLRRELNENGELWSADARDRIRAQISDLEDQRAEWQNVATETAKRSSEILVEILKLSDGWGETSNATEEAIQKEIDALKNRGDAYDNQDDKNFFEQRTILLAEYNNELRITRRLEEEGIITRQEALQQEISETEKLIQLLIELGTAADDPFFRDLVDVVLPELREQLNSLGGPIDSVKKLSDVTDDYRQKLIDLNATEKERIEIQRRRAIQEVVSSNLTAEKTKMAIDAINQYYNALSRLEDQKKSDRQTTGEWAEQQQKIIDELKTSADFVVEHFRNIFTAINQLSDASAQRQIDNLESVLNKQLETLDEQLQAALEAAGVAEETKIESLQRQLEEARAAGDAENIKKLEDEILRLQITEDFEEKKNKAIAEAEWKKSQIQYEAALGEWRIKLALAVADAARAIITGYAQLGPVAGSVAAAATALATGIQIAAMNEAKPQPPEPIDFKTGGFVLPSKKYQTGGIVLPSNGGRLVRVAENGNPELMLNSGSEGQALLDMFAERIASAQGGGGGQMTFIFEMDGKKFAEGNAKYYNDGIVRLRLN